VRAYPQQQPKHDHEAEGNPGFEFHKNPLESAPAARRLGEERAQ
jgi:hypothetical protein